MLLFYSSGTGANPFSTARTAIVGELQNQQEYMGPWTYIGMFGCTFVIGEINS